MRGKKVMRVANNIQFETAEKIYVIMRIVEMKRDNYTRIVC